MDAYAVGTKSMGLALANAAKHKLVGLLAQRLKDDGVYVGEVMIAGVIKGHPVRQRRQRRHQGVDHRRQVLGTLPGLAARRARESPG